MRALKIQQPGELSWQSWEQPEPDDGEVLIRVSHVGICGSDVQLFQGTYKGPFAYPIAFGHEWSGVVERTGKNVRSLRAGDNVTGDCSRFCGTCRYCREDRNLCKDIEKYGITIDGASADYIIRREKYLYKAPAGIDPALLSLSEPLAVSAHLIGKIERCGGPLKGKKVLVLGAGAIGSGAILLLIHRSGCGQVDVFDSSGYRRQAAVSLGAKALGPDALQRGGEGSGYRALYEAEYDAVIESTGNAGVFARSLGLVRPLGVIGCLGMMAEASFPQRQVVMKALTIVGSIGGTGEFPQVIDFIRENPGAVKKMISHRYPIDRAEEAFRMSRQTGEALKVLLNVGEAAR